MARMLPTLLRNVLSRPATRRYPAEEREPFAGARGALANDAEACIFCGLCARKCPSQCLNVDKDSALWAWDPSACVYCGVCVEVCPTHSLSQTEHRRPVSRRKETVVVRGAPAPEKAGTGKPVPAKER